MKAKKKKSKLPWWRQRWFLILMGLAMFLVIVYSPPQENPNVQGAYTSNNSLWSYISHFFNKTSSRMTSESAITTTAAVTTVNSAQLPLGDGKYSTTPRKGYIYTCQSSFNAAHGGAGTDGPWINTLAKIWDATKKVTVSGSHTWANAAFTADISGDLRTLTGNGLPLLHGTGTFPIAANDPAYTYDRNPNSVQTQAINLSLPANPTVLSTPQCINGEVGIMLSGIPLFDGFDAGGRDADAHEVQDECGGHPQEKGMYHYHGISKCVQDKDGLLGYALDGFGIYTSKDMSGRELTTIDLDVCHGITSEVMSNGQKVTMYHYVMTKDFPYSVGCFRGKKAVVGPLTRRPPNRPPPHQQ